MPGILPCWRLLLIWCGFWPLAAPAQTPPPDFRGALFIDASGCVRERAGSDWQARLLPDGLPDCGYPPTPLPAAPAAGFDLPLAPGLPEPEARLLAVLAEGLRPGDFQPPVPVPDPPALGHPALDAIALASSAEGLALRGAAAGDRPNARLCALLGQEPAPGGGALGADPSRGFCAGEGARLFATALRPAAQLPVAGRGGAPAGRIDRPADAGASESPPIPAAPVLAPPSRPDSVLSAAAPAGPGRVAGAVAPSRSRAVLAPAAVTDAAMIPAGARYLQLGGAVDPPAASALFDRLALLGLPMARGRVAGGGILVMAGPFDSREAIVRAHSRLRAAGFGALVPR